MKLRAVLYLFSCLIVLVFTSCNNNSVKKNTPADSLGNITGMDSLDYGITPQNKIDSSFAGFYQSDLNCKDCKVVQTLLLEPDGRFVLEDLRKDSLKTMHEYKGTWAFTDSTIILFEQKAIVGKYEITGNKIRTIERQGLILPDSIADKNILRKKPSVIENKVWQNKKHDGISFYGIGTEPFWNLTLIWDSIISFNQMDEETITFNFQQPVINSDSLIFTPAKDFNITLIHGICNDGMSDYFYDYKVILKKDSIVYSGCGFLLNKKSDFISVQ